MHQWQQTFTLTFSDKERYDKYIWNSVHISHHHHDFFKQFLLVLENSYMMLNVHVRSSYCHVMNEFSLRFKTYEKMVSLVL